MKPMSIENFVRSPVELNPDMNPAELRSQVAEAVRHKKAGARCMICDAPIWAIGVAMGAFDGCFTCITGEADDSDDCEIDEVCW